MSLGLGENLSSLNLVMVIGEGDSHERLSDVFLDDVAVKGESK